MNQAGIKLEFWEITNQNASREARMHRVTQTLSYMAVIGLKPKRSSQWHKRATSSQYQKAKTGLRRRLLAVFRHRQQEAHRYRYPI
jgi:hypothetical protein